MTAPVRTVAVKFTAQGSEAVQQAMDRISTSARQASERAASSAARAAARTVEIQAAAVQTSAARTAKSVAISLDQIASTGQVTSAVLRKVVSDAANVALMFGRTGPILAAVGIAGLAVFNFFANARAERQRLEDEAIAGINRLVNAGDFVGLTERARTVWQGTASKEFKDGLGPRLAALGLPLADMSRLNDELAIADRLARVRVEGMAARAGEIRQVIDLRKEYDDLVKTIKNANNAPQFVPATTPITTSAPSGLRYSAADIQRFRGGADPARLGDFSQRLNPAVDGALAPFAKIQPFGDPKKFADQLSKDLAESFNGFKLPPLPEPVQWRRDFAEKITNAVVDGFAFGIERAVASGSIGEGFLALTGSLLSGLGGAMVEFGKASLLAATLMESIQKGLNSFLPGGAAVAAAAMIGIGAALRGAASRAFGGMGGGGGRGGGRSYGSLGAAAGASAGSATRLVFGNNSVTTAAGMTPRAFNQIIVIGEDDPRAQRALTNILAKAEGRGLTTSRSR